jgi:S-disulfanyl-L-cysteine oxidoreductase SoxD
MSLHRRIALLAPFALAFCARAANAADAPGLGKPVSEADLALWDISIGPDGKGLPAGSGTPTEGAAIYAQKCEVCHGKNGYGGKNAVLATPPDKPGRTMATYVPHVTTIFDFTRRAMPWPQPKSLTNDEVYALTAYILARNKIIGENDVMNKDTLAKVQMPNRDAFVSRYPEKR